MAVAPRPTLADDIAAIEWAIAYNDAPGGERCECDCGGESKGGRCNECLRGEIAALKSAASFVREATP